MTDEIYALAEPHSLHHLFKVACGLDSMVLGETEILGQIKKAYHLALQHNHTAGILNKAFQKAFNVAKQIRSETAIQRGSVSVGSVAVELAEKIFSALDHRHVMVIGAGETSEKTARALLARGARSIIVSNRSHERAVALASELGGQAVHFDEWSREFEKIDIVISSTAAPHYILDRVKLGPLMKLRKKCSSLCSMTALWWCFGSTPKKTSPPSGCCRAMRPVLQTLTASRSIRRTDGFSSPTMER